MRYAEWSWRRDELRDRKKAVRGKADALLDAAEAEGRARLSVAEGRRFGLLVEELRHVSAKLKRLEAWGPDGYYH